MAEKVLKKLKKEVQEKCLKLSITEGGKEGKSKVMTSCKCLEVRFQKCSQKERVVLATSNETLGAELKTRTDQLGAKEKNEKKEVGCEILADQEKSCLSDKLHEDWCF